MSKFTFMNIILTLTNRVFILRILLLMCFLPVLPDLVFTGGRAAQPEVLPAELNGFHEEAADVFGDFLRSCNCLAFVVDMDHLGPIPPPLVPGLGDLPVPDHGSQLDQHGPGRLQHHVQGGVTGAHREAAFIEPVEEAARGDGVLNGLAQAFERRELGFKAFAEARSDCPLLGR